MATAPKKYRPDQAAHDTIVRRVAVAMAANGVRDVQADVPGFITPSKIIWTATQRGHVPDATGGGAIYEVETAASISDPHTEEQCRLFAAFARQHGKKFAVVVPVGYGFRMRWQLIRWGIVGAEVIEM